jgi:ankyrin repeat protein
MGKGFKDLFNAVVRGDAAEVERLIPISRVKARNQFRMTALMWAAAGPLNMQGAEMVVMLIPHSNVKAADRDGTTALMWAAGAGQVACVKALLPHSDARACSASGRTAQDLAQYYDHNEIAAYIGAYIRAQDERRALSEVAAAPARRASSNRL